MLIFRRRFTLEDGGIDVYADDGDERDDVEGALPVISVNLKEFKE